MKANALFEYFLNERLQTVNVNRNLSECLDVKRGGTQGTVLGSICIQ